MTRPCAAIVALVALVAGVLVTGCSAPPLGSDRMEVTVYLADSAGLFEGNDVGVLGVPVGEVTEIEPDGDRVRVTIEVDGERAYPAEVGAAVVARSVATDRYLELTPVYDGGPELEEGAEIPVERTRTPVDFDQVLEALNTFSTGIAGSARTRNAVQRFIDAADDAFSGRGEEFNETVTDLAGVAGTVSDQREDISGTIRALDTLVAAIADDQQTVRTFIDQVDRGAQLLVDERENFRALLRSLNRSVTTISRFVSENRQELTRLLGRSNKLFETMLAKRTQLAQTLRVFPLALENLTLLGVEDPDRVAVRVPPEYILPLGDVLAQLCGSVPVDVCDLIARQPARPRAGGPR
jgi:phospholipid/cholesterol/gamma-HCH transport system substrate-binding protein